MWRHWLRSARIAALGCGRARRLGRNRSNRIAIAAGAVELFAPGDRSEAAWAFLRPPRVRGRILTKAPLTPLRSYPVGPMLRYRAFVQARSHRRDPLPRPRRVALAKFPDLIAAA